MARAATEHDVLVVGGGIAGLTAAAYLCRAGLSVLLCEKEQRTGGLVNTFKYKGFILDGGIRATENTGIVLPMLRQLGIEVEFLPNPVSVGIGKDVIRITSKESLNSYRGLLEKHFPESKEDVARIIREVDKVMGLLDVLYGIDNPLFMDLKGNPGFVLRTIMPWLVKYLLATPRIARLNKPVEKHLSGLSSNRALVDIIAQHFFRETPAFFALSYFSIYLDYRYPRGGTGTLTRAIERYALEHGAEVRTGTEITSVDPEANRATDSNGNEYRYRKLVWAADQNALYRRIDLARLTNQTTVRRIAARQQVLSGKTGGDSVFTLYLMLNLDREHFSRISTGHFFYTPSIAGLSNAGLDELLADRKDPARFTGDKAAIVAWLKRFLELTTYEISCPAMRDGSMAPEGKTALIISSLFDYSLVKHIQATGWYEEFKQLMADGMVRVLDASIYPGLAAAVIDSFTSTPLTIERVSGNFEGAITGWAFTNDFMPAVSRQPMVASSVLTPVPDTYQAGQWTFSPSGMPIAILTGKLAADRILKDLK
jgi:phytoene dehydrogenase-like protein